MGMFDTVRITCPHCGKTHHEQTKSGPCVLDDVDLDKADPSLIPGLSDARGLVWCEHCNQPMRIEVLQRPVYQVVRITAAELMHDD